MKLNELKILKDCYFRLHISDRDLKKGLLGKRTYKWDTPYDLKNLAEATKRAFIGLGKWKNNTTKFICIANEKDIYYFDLIALKELIKEIEKGWLRG